MTRLTITHHDARIRQPLSVTQLEFEALDHTHAEVVQTLRELERLLNVVDAGDASRQAREAARSVCEFFDGTARRHHEEEERVVFPPLLTGSDVGLAQHVRRLQQDHGWLEEDWREMRPLLGAIADGLGGVDVSALRQMAGVFSALYVDHIALEESLVYPAARQCLMANEIAARRRAEPSL